MHKVISSIAVQLTVTFSAIFLYKFFNNNHESVIWLNIIISLASFIIFFFIKSIIDFMGYKKSMIIGSVFRFFLWVSFFLTSYYSWEYGIYLIGLSIIGVRIFYWTPSHTEFISLRKEVDHSKSVSLKMIIRNMTGIVAPVVSGVIISFYSFSVLYGIGALFLIAAIYPLTKLEKLNNIFEWNAKRFFKESFSKKDTRFKAAAFFEGGQSMVSLIWPIFIYELTNGDFLKIGIISSVTTLIVISLSLYIGKIIDRKKKGSKILKYGTFLHGIGWIVKIFITSVFHIFVMDIYHKVTRAIYSNSFDSLWYGYAFDRKNLVDEFIAIREIFIMLGQIVFGLLLLGFSVFVELNWLFILGAISILFYNIVPEQNNNIKKNE